MILRPPTKGLWRWVKRVWRTLKREQLTPGRFGLAVGVGLFFGLSPFWGFQIIGAFVVGHLLKLNKLAVAAGVSISAPPFLPFEVLASVQLGQRILYGTWAPLSYDQVRASELTVLAKYWGSSFFVGGLVLATVISVPAAFFAASRMRRATQEKRPELPLDALEALDDALPRLPGRFRTYVALKVWMDPVYAIVLPALAGRTNVLDLGAGFGILAFFLKQGSAGVKVRCVEWDEAKADCARKLLGDEADVVTADARTVDLGTPDAIVLMDVLHYIPIEEQRAWLDRCVKALPPKGRLVLRELDTASGSTAKNLEEQAVKRRWNKGEGVYPWPIDDLKAHLESQGLEVTRTPVGRLMFRANSLLVATRP